MARKLLIIFAFIIAIFPFLGFSETADTSVTTTLSLFIAVTLLFSRKPKMIPNSQPEQLPKNMPSPFISKMHVVPVNHPDTNILNSTSSIINPIIIKHIDHEAPASIPSPLPIMPKRRVPFAKNISEEKNEILEHSLDMSEAITPIRKPRKNSHRDILAQEEHVHPADIPTQTHRE